MTTAADIFEELVSAAHCFTREAPRDRRGLYGLIDHERQLRYIGSTASATQTLYERIHQRHRTGSETHSHYFARMYNTGRMWRDRLSQRDNADASTAKKLRNAFIEDHCRAVWITLPDDAAIVRLEQEVLRLAPPDAVSWNFRRRQAYDEPEDLVDQTIERLRFSEAQVGAVERQRAMHLSSRSL